MMFPMRATRVVLSIFVLIAIVIGAPLTARARIFDQAADVVDFDLEGGTAAEVPDLGVAPPIRSFVIIDLETLGEPPGPRKVAVLSCAPKTSPPGR
jgi:hypothetical protein